MTRAVLTWPRLMCARRSHPLTSGFLARPILLACFLVPGQHEVVRFVHSRAFLLQALSPSSFCPQCDTHSRTRLFIYSIDIHILFPLRPPARLHSSALPAFLWSWSFQRIISLDIAPRRAPSAPTGHGLNPHRRKPTCAGPLRTKRAQQRSRRAGARGRGRSTARRRAARR